MSCSCSRTHRVKPYETCIFCAHKHIAAALALRDESCLVGQLILASWHYRDDFPEMEAACIECAERIERAEPVPRFAGRPLHPGVANGIGQSREQGRLCRQKR